MPTAWPASSRDLPSERGGCVSTPFSDFFPGEEDLPAVAIRPLASFFCSGNPFSATSAICDFDRCLLLAFFGNGAGGVQDGGQKG